MQRLTDGVSSKIYRKRQIFTEIGGLFRPAGGLPGEKSANQAQMAIRQRRDALLATGWLR
jgi:hypothetical protein